MELYSPKLELKNYSYTFCIQQVFKSIIVFQMWFCESNSSNIKTYNNMYCILVESMILAFEEPV